MKTNNIYLPCQLTLVSRQLTLVSRQLTLVSHQLTLVSRQLTLVSRQLTLVSRQLTLVSRQLTLVARGGSPSPLLCLVSCPPTLPSPFPWGDQQRGERWLGGAHSPLSSLPPLGLGWSETVIKRPARGQTPPPYPVCSRALLMQPYCNRYFSHV
jgi:hypothetical protein